MKILKLTILFLCLTVNASAQPFGGSFNPEGPSSTYQIFTNTNKFVGILDASDITVQQALEDLSFIVASPTTVTSEWNFANGNLVLPQGTTCPNAGTCTDGAICYDTNATSGQRVYACESGTWTLQGDGGVGGGDSVIFNGTAATDVAFNESSPSIPASGLGVKWQTTGSSPTNVTAYAAVNTSSVLAGVLSDETGTGALVFGTSPTIATPIETGKTDRNNVAVDDDDCTGEQGLYWYDTTDSRFEFCDANSGTPTAISAATDTNAVKEYWWPASASLPLEVGDSIPPISKDAGTNIDQLTVDFDDSTDECRTVSFKVPSDVTSGSTITFRAHWYSAAATSGNVILDFRHNGGVAEGTDPDQALTTVAAAADATQGTAGQLTVTTWTETLANLGWAANEQVDAEFCRDANNASDTLVGDEKFTGFGVEIPRS